MERDYFISEPSSVRHRIGVSGKNHSPSTHHIRPDAFPFSSEDRGRDAINLFSSCLTQWSGIIRHAQVIEHAPGVEGALSHELGDGLVGFLERLEDADRDATPMRAILWVVAGAHATAILIVVPVDDGVHCLDAPVAAIDAQDLFG